MLDGSSLVATVPATIAAQIRETRRHLATRPLPFVIKGVPTELLWPSSTDDDDACRFLHGKIVELARSSSPKPKRA
ncbi:hypothetical protein WMF37_00625 [Sorangium sp. So ce291]|uniref:hypothetical protein n=1 Tax=Sorangium sp. So ce291 TaxID=3133294 RepID=UPI003F5D8D0B